MEQPSSSSQTQHLHWDKDRLNTVPFLCIFDPWLDLSLCMAMALFCFAIPVSKAIAMEPRPTSILTHFFMIIFKTVDAASLHHLNIFKSGGGYRQHGATVRRIYPVAADC